MAGNLRITEVERYVVDVPFTDRCATWNDLQMSRYRVREVFRLVTNSSEVVGYGEAPRQHPRRPGSSSDEAVERIRGANPAELLWDDSLGVGLQMALLDVVGKALDVPMHQLLGLPQVRGWCPLAWWSVELPPKLLAEEALDAVANGYRAHKFKARPWMDVYAQVEAVSEAVPTGYSLGPDWNWMLLDAANAVPVLTELDRSPVIGLYESPIAAGDFEGCRRLRDMLRHPIVEHFSISENPLRIDLAQTLSLPRSSNGLRAEVYDGYVFAGAGVSGILQQGIAAAALNKPGWIQEVGTGLTTAFVLHLGAVLSHARLPSSTALNTFVDDLIETPIPIRHGYAKVPQGPGLGVVPDMDAIARFEMAPPYQLVQPRTILALTLEGNRTYHYADVYQLWRECARGEFPVQDRGANLAVHTDDGTADFQEFYQRVESAPGL